MKYPIGTKIVFSNGEYYELMYFHDGKYGVRPAGAVSASGTVRESSIMNEYDRRNGAVVVYPVNEIVKNFYGQSA